MTEEKRREGLDDLTSFLNVHDDGTLNEAVNKERTQLERTEVEDERVRRDPLMALMDMKRKQREQRKRYREKHPEIFVSRKEGTATKHPEVIRDQNKRYRQKNREKLTEIKRKKYREAHPEGVPKQKKQRFNVLKKNRPLRESTSIKGQWQANAQCLNNIIREQEAQTSC